VVMPALRPVRTEQSVQRSPVSAHNEWDPLEEVVVGVIDGACKPEWHVCLEATLPDDQRAYFADASLTRFPAARVEAAARELDELARILEAEGVSVVRPDPHDHSAPFATPAWSSRSGLYTAMPRDFVLVVGDEIIESPMSWRSRYFEAWPYRRLFKNYFRAGARWTAAPHPQLTDELYEADFICPGPGEPARYVTTEFEPVFDAADFLRLGRDIVAQRSNVTNRMGIEWLARHLGDDYRVHVLEFDDPHPMHIDATLMPLGPGKLLVNPTRVPTIPSIFRGWDVFVAPEPSIPESHPMYMCSRWINMNILMLDERRVVVEEHDEPMIRAFESWGFDPVPCPFRNFNSFGGSFHCATIDIRRRGPLERYIR
jgi:glycine amidinotransferase